MEPLCITLHLILFCNGYLYSLGFETYLITDYSKVASSPFISSDQTLGLYMQFLTYKGSVLSVRYAECRKWFPRNKCQEEH